MCTLHPGPALIALTNWIRHKPALADIVMRHPKAREFPGMLVFPASTASLQTRTSRHPSLPQQQIYRPPLLPRYADSESLPFSDPSSQINRHGCLQCGFWTMLEGSPE